MQKKYLIIVLAVVGVTAGILSAGNIYAQSESSTSKSIVQRIAEKFNLNQADVQLVFDEQKTEMKAQHEQMLNEKLSALVTEGKLTEDQKTKLLAKLSERKDMKEEFKNLTREEMQTERTEFETWLKDNGIDIESLGLNMRMGFGGRGGPGHGGPRGFEEKQTE